MTKDNLNVDKLITSIKYNIDRLHSHFEKVKDQILEVARILDESKQCERSSISRKIKELLQDKIKEGKITPKWIEECLPQEYKRKYIKSEQSSLSETNSGNDKVQVVYSGVQSGSETTLKNARNFGSDVEPSPVLPDDRSNTIECLSCRELSNTVKELSEALTKATKFSTADSLIQSDLDPKRDSPVPAYKKEIRDILEFEFCLLFGDLSRYMTPMYPKIGDAGKVWFSGRLDITTRKVLSARPGRIEES